MTTLPSIESLMRDARWNEARRECRALLDHRPADPKLQALLGICHFRLAEYVEAERCFERATILDPAFVVAGVKRCQCLERIGDVGRAVAVAQRWSARAPENPTLQAMIRTHGPRPERDLDDAWTTTERQIRSIDL